MSSLVKYVDHTYRDYSRYIEDGGELIRHKKSNNNFTARLHRVLSDPQNSAVITWMPHGRAFKILSKEKLISDVLPNYYVCKKYESFSRQLNGWGFKRLHQSGPDLGCYYHECFLRGLPDLTCLIRRLPSNLGKSTPFPDGEPDFYMISEQFPVPPKITEQRQAAINALGNGMMANPVHQAPNPPPSASAVAAAPSLSMQYGGASHLFPQSTEQLLANQNLQRQYESLLLSQYGGGLGQSSSSQQPLQSSQQQLQSQQQQLQSQHQLQTQQQLHAQLQAQLELQARLQAQLNDTYAAYSKSTGGGGDSLLSGIGGLPPAGGLPPIQGLPAQNVNINSGVTSEESKVDKKDAAATDPFAPIPLSESKQDSDDDEDEQTTKPEDAAPTPSKQPAIKA